MHQPAVWQPIFQEVRWWEQGTNHLSDSLANMVKICGDEIKRNSEKDSWRADQKQLTELFENDEKEYQNFIRIIKKFVCQARIRQAALRQCNLWDWLRLQWHIFKRSICQLTGIKERLTLEQEIEENQVVYCSRIMKRLGTKNKEKKKIS